MYLAANRYSLLMVGTPYGTPDDVVATLRSEFDMLYEESTSSLRMFKSCVHRMISGRPFGASVLQNFIEYCLGQDGMRFLMMQELANLNAG